MSRPSFFGLPDSPPGSPAPFEVKCQFNGKKGLCDVASKCSGASDAYISSADGATGCQNLPASHKCCIREAGADISQPVPCTFDGTSGACRSTSTCDGSSHPSKTGAIGCESFASRRAVLFVWSRAALLARRRQRRVPEDERVRRHQQAVEHGRHGLRVAAGRRAVLLCRRRSARGDVVPRRHGERHVHAGDCVPRQGDDDGGRCGRLRAARQLCLLHTQRQCADNDDCGRRRRRVDDHVAQHRVPGRRGEGLRRRHCARTESARVRRCCVRHWIVGGGDDARARLAGRRRGRARLNE
eukprot:TRINITY_DN4072_c0_g1_i4.p1 TRINITY_DN4072_c0_g1~~TRINITY_DN4072_c0_g1_i4.p1  ORF type:complete len:316 (+),score=129.11 TRINITY_DN4072_c0_g1_i4:55-948(+)